MATLFTGANWFQRCPSDLAWPQAMTGHASYAVASVSSVLSHAADSAA